MITFKNIRCTQRVEGSGCTENRVFSYWKQYKILLEHELHTLDQGEKDNQQVLHSDQIMLIYTIIHCKN